MKNIAVIGAGLAGLTFSNQLKSKANITLFEKSRGVGGRLATRRAFPYQFDHGAQFIKAHDATFKSFLKSLQKKDVVQPWCARFAEIRQGQIQSQRVWNEEVPHYVGVPGMNAIAKNLAEPLNVILNTRIVTVEKREGIWLLKDNEQQEMGRFDWLVLATPAPQALDLYPALSALGQTKQLDNMKGCYALMLGFDSPLKLPFDIALVRNSCVNLISVNSTKPNRSDACTLVIHADNDWSQQHIDADPKWVEEMLLKEASKQLQVKVNQAEHIALHRWRYANQSKQHGPSHYIDSNQNIAACGDWFIKGKVEAAFQSGLDLSAQF